MRYFPALPLVAIVATLLPHAVRQQISPLEASRRVCAGESSAYIAELRKELIRTRQPAWTAHEEAAKVDALLDMPYSDPDGRKKFDEEFRREAANLKEDIDKAVTWLVACGVTVANNWEAGVRDVARIRQRWAEAKPRYSLPASAPSATAAPIAKPAPEDPYASAPVDCVRLNDTPGSFKNVCDFPVYFTYCGINPHPESWVARCDDPNNKMGLDGIAANGVQGGFTRAETMHWFACRKPKTPKDVKFIPGKGLYGSCK